MGTTESSHLHHTCFVVRDLEKAAKELADSLSIRPWNVWTIEPEACTVHGENVPYSFRVALAQVGGSGYELIQPLAGESVYIEDLQQAKDLLLRQGREMIQTGDLGEAGEFCYFHVPEVDAFFELLCLKELPPPEMTIE
jgi:hypothetical protein